METQDGQRLSGATQHNGVASQVFEHTSDEANDQASKRLIQRRLIRVIEGSSTRPIERATSQNFLLPWLSEALLIIDLIASLKVLFLCRY